MGETKKGKKGRMRKKKKKAEKDIKSKIKHLVRSGVHTRVITASAKGYKIFQKEKKKKNLEVPL